jgi:hypothetical protein
MHAGEDEKNNRQIFIYNDKEFKNDAGIRHLIRTKSRKQNSPDA